MKMAERGPCGTAMGICEILTVVNIVGVEMFGVDLPQTEVTKISGGREIAVQESTIVAVSTDSGLLGWGESCPWSASYLPAFAGSVRAAVALMAPHLIGADPCNLGAVRQVMDGVLAGQPQAKHAIDVACWDILGKALGVPLHVLLGGKLTERLPLAGFLHNDWEAEQNAEQISRYRAERRPHLEVKATGDVQRDVQLIELITGLMVVGEPLKVDANGGWLVQEAAAEMAAAADHTLLFEQPCATLEQCRALRRLTPRPIILDEVVLSDEDVVRGFADGVATGINLKLARVGGLTPARSIRDLCASLGLPLIVQCVGGSEITSAAIAHFASTIPGRLLTSVWDATSMISVSTAAGLPEAGPAALVAPNQPGLGVEPRRDVLGSPLYRFA